MEEGEGSGTMKFPWQKREREETKTAQDAGPGRSDQGVGSGISGVGHRVLNGLGTAWRWTWLNLNRWGPPGLVAFASLAFIVFVWWFAGLRSVFWGFVLAAITAWPLWRVIKVYYVHLIEVSLDGSGQLSLGFVDVPMDLAPSIEINGARGFVRDRWGRELILCSYFNPDTLTGIGTWPGNLTPLHFAARWETAENLVETQKMLVMRYGVASVHAHLDTLGNMVKVAEYASSMMNVEGEDLDGMINKALGRNEEYQ